MLTKVRLNEVLNEFKNKRIAVIGDMMLDEYIIGKVERISPEAPVPVVQVESEMFVLGGAANVINNLTTLGAKVSAFGVVGEDLNGNKLQKELEKRGVDTKGVVEDATRPTIVKKRVIAHNQQLLRLDWEKKKDIVSNVKNSIIEILKSEIESIDAFILSDYDKGVLTSELVKEVIETANKYNKIVIVDPKPSNAMNYIGATSMTPNKKEAVECLKAKEPETDEDLKNIGKSLKEKLKLRNLLMTRSEKGMSLFSDNKIDDIPTFAKDVYDVTGAGDTVIAVYTLAVVAGASFYEAAKIANTAAGIVVGRVGTSTVTKEEIAEFYGELYKGE